MYYPDQRAISAYTIIERQCMLPEEALGRVRRLEEGSRVDVRDVVAEGVISTGYVIVDVAGFFGTHNAEKLAALVLVNKNDVVEEGAVIAGKNANRGKRMTSPIRGIVSYVGDGRIVIQQLPQVVEVEAGIRGKIAAIQERRGVIIEAVGSHVQGIWGNNRRVISTLRMEPKNGIEQNASSDLFDNRFAGAVVVTRQPITARVLRMMEEQGLNGVIAPSMDISLRSTALRTDKVVILTEGFGNLRMNNATFTVLQEFDGQQVTVDASMPNRWESRYPEIVINRSRRDGQRPTRPNPMLALREGLNVRVTRDPYLGQTGQVVDLPKTPTLLDNGLRVSCAHVELVTGDTVAVPLANLEILSR
ncbi:MAG: hypothetical protein OHK0046_13840 [Anaerolineae bacterium]